MNKIGSLLLSNSKKHATYMLSLAVIKQYFVFAAAILNSDKTARQILSDVVPLKSSPPKCHPRSLHNRIRSALPPSPRVKSQDCAFSVAAPRVWNNLSSATASLQSLSAFRKALAENGTFQSLIPRLTSIRHNADYVTQMRLQPRSPLDLRRVSDTLV